MTNTLNPGLAVTVYQQFDGSHMASCFVADLGQDIDNQAIRYLEYEGTQYSNIIATYWHNALEDQYGNRYEPKIEQIG